jgi:thiol-disulfide isomerase/thioredoxin
MLSVMFALIAAAAPGDLKSDYANLETASAAVEKASEAWRADQKNNELRDKFIDANKKFDEASKKFAQACSNGTLTPDAAALLVKASGEKSALSQLPFTWSAEMLDSGHAKEFLASLPVLEKAGFKGPAADSLNGQRAIALYATGQEKQAEDLVTKLAEQSGARGLEYIDIQAAILAGHGKYQEAHDLYENWSQKYSKKGERSEADIKLQLIGKPAPEITASTWLAPGGEVTKGFSGLEDLKGGVVVLDFWQTWCPPCRAVMPSLSKLQSKFKPEEARILGMCYKDGRGGFDYADQKGVEPTAIAGDKYVPHVQKFMKDIKLTYTVGIADDNKNSKGYFITGIPTLVVLDADGNVAWLTVGASPGVELLLETLIHKLSGGQTG